MHPLALLLALVLPCALSAGEGETPAFTGSPLPAGPVLPHLPIPVSCKELVTQEKWDRLPTWQRAYIQNAATDSKWRKKEGITESLWARYPGPKRSLLIFNALQRETDNTFYLEVDRLYVQMAHFEADREKGKDMTLAQRHTFAHQALNLETEYPGATPGKEQAGSYAKVRSAGAKYELEAEYMASHKIDAMLGEQLQAIRAAGKADKATLDKLFEGTPAGNVVVPKLGAALPQQTGPAAHPLPVGAAGMAAGATLTPPRIRFESIPPTDPAFLKIWTAAGGAAKEKSFYDSVMAGLKTETEVAVLERLGRNQRENDANRQKRLGEITRDLTMYTGEYKRLRFSPTAGKRRAAIRDAMNLLLDEQTRLKSTSSEVVVSFKELENAAGNAYWETTPGADGRITLRMNMDRKKVLTAMAEERATHEYGMKLFTHEFSHNADQADPKGMITALTERLAYLNGAKAWKEEGEPGGYWEIQWEGIISNTLKRNPINWTVAHLTTSNYIEEKAFWSYVMPDDIRDPEAGLRWRLKAAYNYATRLDHPDADPRADAARTSEKLKKLETGDDFNFALASVYRDPTIPGSKKADIFADRAAQLKVSRDWIAATRNTSNADALRLSEAYQSYWRSLAAFYLSK